MSKSCGMYLNKARIGRMQMQDFGKVQMTCLSLRALIMVSRSESNGTYNWEFMLPVSQFRGADGTGRDTLV